MEEKQTQNVFDIQNIIRTDESGQIKVIITDFVESWAKHPNEQPEIWLLPKMKSYLPDKSDAELSEIVRDICDAIQAAESSQKSLNNAISEGKSVKGWLASQYKEAVKDLPDEEKSAYLNEIKSAAAKANEEVSSIVMNATQGVANE